MDAEVQKFLDNQEKIKSTLELVIDAKPVSLVLAYEDADGKCATTTFGSNGQVAWLQTQLQSNLLDRAKQGMKKQ